MVGAGVGITVRQTPGLVLRATRAGQAEHRYGIGVARPVTEPHHVPEGAVGRRVGQVLD